MKYVIHHQSKARQDLKNIWFYSFDKFGQAQADKYFDELESAFKTLQDNPQIGVICDYIRPDYRQFKINHHYIFYKISQQTIQVIRVLHESMQLESHL